MDPSRALALQNNDSLFLRFVECTKAFWAFGFTTFGGPSANIVYLRRMFVNNKKWLDDNTFADFFAISSTLPGPAFSQLTFTVALVRGGLLCGLWAFVLGTFPGSIAMIALGYGVREIPSELPSIVLNLFTGLNSAAVGLIALAAYQLSKKAITDHVSRAMLFISAAATTCYSSEWLFPVMMVGAGIVTYLHDELKPRREAYLAKKERQRQPHTPEPEDRPQSAAAEEIALSPMNQTSSAPNAGITPPPPVVLNEVGPRQRRPSTTSKVTAEGASATPSIASVQHSAEEEEEQRGKVRTFGLGLKGGIAALVAFVVAFAVLLGIRAAVPFNRAYDMFCNFMIVGTIIFGGGPVVIPLLRGYTVDAGYVDASAFLFGFAILQALPGPFFNFAAFLGILTLPYNPPLGAFLGLVALFAPGLILQLAVLPIYGSLRTKRATRSVLRGITAGAVGLIYAATWRLFNQGVVRNSINGSRSSLSLSSDGWWGVLAAFAFVACDDAVKLPPPVAILAGAVGGILKWAVTEA